MTNDKPIRVSFPIGSLIEATCGDDTVMIDSETGETVTTSVPVGSDTWRRLAHAARNWRPQP